MSACGYPGLYRHPVLFCIMNRFKGGEIALVRVRSSISKPEFCCENVLFERAFETFFYNFDCEKLVSCVCEHFRVRYVVDRSLCAHGHQGHL